MLAVDVSADRDSPAVSRSVRDGYAVRSSDLPGELRQQLAAEFGLTPVARARIASAGFEPPGPPSKFDGLLG